MKAVMLSIQPKWCELIASGKKTIEVRKTAPKLETPFKCYIYCTASDVHSCLVVGGGNTELFHCCNYKTAFVGGGVVGNGKVIAEFVCDSIEQFTVGSLRCDDIEKQACLSYKEMLDYFYKPNELDGKTVKFGYAWHISDLKIYDTPKELGEFKTPTKAIITNTFNLEYGKPLTRPFQSWGYVEELNESRYFQHE